MIFLHFHWSAKYCTSGRDAQRSGPNTLTHVRKASFIAASTLLKPAILNANRVYVVFKELWRIKRCDCDLMSTRNTPTVEIKQALNHSDLKLYTVFRYFSVNRPWPCVWSTPYIAVLINWYDNTCSKMLTNEKRIGSATRFRHNRKHYERIRQFYRFDRIYSCLYCRHNRLQ